MNAITYLKPRLTLCENEARELRNVVYPRRQSFGWDLTADCLCRLVHTDGGQGAVAIPAPRMTVARQGHLCESGLPEG